MVSTSLTYPTKKIETSSDGASQNVFTKKWNLSEYDATSDSLAKGRIGEVEVIMEPGAFHFSFRFSHFTRTSDEEELNAFVKRIQIAGLLFTHIPDEGLDELFDSISDLISFYELASKTQPTLPPKSVKTKVKLKSPTIRPEFPILPDEV